MLVVGLAALVVGLIMFFAWLGAVLALVKALFALGLIGAGVVTIYLGWEEFREQKRPNLDFSSPAEADRYRAEAAAYQAKLTEISNKASPAGPSADGPEKPAGP
jgi:threonine/homoserine/homoserine lactone efflux protein